ncbi:MAG: DNA primase [Alphaproteobacteria bacterium]|nr:DNA primase [Alphaproteobacteria bacterium]
MRFTPRFLDDIRARASLEAIVGRRVRLVRRGRELTGLCPFHQEKTPSFTVSDQKGFFHCFGCGAHGDVIGFTMRAEGLSFPEAVERLAHEVGLELPKEDPRERERHAVEVTLGGAVEAAAAFFEGQLKTESGRAARDYLTGRGLSAKTIEQFRLGVAPQSRGALKAALIAHGIPEAILVEAGLLIEPEGGAERYDRFRGRVMFPIRDPKGRVVAFGGRILGQGEPKYLNSPETPLFHKGAMLYGLDLAGQAARKANRIVLVEGYMDVIALHQAGLAEAVAPLGTALTELQLELLWRYAASPILCFDGDAAGERAAARVVERALPRLKAGFSLRFATLPAGEDPDSLIAHEGRTAIEKVLERSVPFSDALWRLVVGQTPLDSPEARAAIGREFERRLAEVTDRDLRFHYLRHFRQKLNEAGFRARRFEPGAKPGQRRAGPPRLAAPSRPVRRADERLRERSILQLLLNHPALLGEFGDEIAHLTLIDQRHGALRDFLVGLPEDVLMDRAELGAALAARGLDAAAEGLIGEGARFLDWAADPGAESGLEDARAQLRQALDLHHKLVELEALRHDAVQGLARDLSDENLTRLVGILHAIDGAPGTEDAAPTGVAAPGSRRS